MNNKIEKKVLVALSGGVDSSTAAFLLKRIGYDVIGIHLKFFRNKDKNTEEIKKFSQKIKIPLKIINVYREFKEKIIDYFLEELKNGNTPNPCIICNKEIKFKNLFEEMAKIKADFIATGHYARLRREIQNPKRETRNIFRLFEAKDKNKDQSYFLYRLKSEQLSKILFPLGDYTKTEVRKMAKKFNLVTKDKKESQDICFIPSGKYEKFLNKNLGLKKGGITDLAGNFLGNHKGLHFYTIGQRKGVKIGGSGPYYVIHKDFKKNELIVSNKKKDLALFTRKITLKDINWITKAPKLPFKALFRIRYRNPLVYGIIETHSAKRATHNAKYMLKFNSPQRAVTPGQSAVFYSKKGEVLGGGIIV